MSDAVAILNQIVKELGITNVKIFGYHKNKWVVKFKKGRQCEFDSFSEMYDYLKTG